MTFSHKEASEQIARIYGVDIEVWIVDKFSLCAQKADVCFFTQDIGALMSLAIMNDIIVHPNNVHKFVRASRITLVEIFESKEYYEDHNNDPIEATRVAIAKALIKKGGK